MVPATRRGQMWQDAPLWKGGELERDIVWDAHADSVPASGARVMSWAEFQTHGMFREVVCQIQRRDDGVDEWGKLMLGQRGIVE